jgi:hypothetical protein
MKSKTLLTAALLALATVTMLPIYSAKADTWVWTGNVSSSGAITNGPVLLLGAVYHIEADETFWYNYTAGLCADAMYYTTDPSNGWQWGNNFAPPSRHSFLQIDGQDMAWGAFSNGDTGHSYSVVFMGTGAAISLQIVDWMDGDYSNNNCHLRVNIYLVSPHDAPEFPTPILMILITMPLLAGVVLTKKKLGKSQS